MKSSNLFLAGIILILIVLVATNAETQQPSTDRLKDLNTKIGVLLTQMDERAKNYPQIIDELRQRRAGIEKAGEEVQKMLNDLKQMTDQMDVNSDYHSELNAFENHTSDMIATVEARDDPKLETIVKSLDEALKKLQSIDRRRAAAVIQAHNIIRALEDQQEILVLIRQVGHIEAAVEIFESSLGEYENIVSTAQGIQADMTAAISTP